MAHGIDLSNNNAGPIDYTDVEFELLKIDQGTRYVDPTFSDWKKEADRRSIPWGGYHFAEPDLNTADEEADHFLGHYTAGKIPPSLDCETRVVHGQTINPLTILGPEKLGAWCNRYCVRIHDALNQVPFFYSYRDMTSHLLPYLDAWPLWLATASGRPAAFKSFLGRPVIIEQWGIVDGVDQNESYTDLAPVPVPHPLPEEDVFEAMYVVIEGKPNEVWVASRTLPRPWRVDSSEPGGFLHAAEQALTSGIRINDPPASVYKVTPVKIGTVTENAAVIEAARAAEFGIH